MASSYGTIEFYQERAADFMKDCGKDAEEYREREKLLAVEIDKTKKLEILRKEQDDADARFAKLMKELKAIPAKVYKQAGLSAKKAIKELRYG